MQLRCRQVARLKPNGHNNPIRHKPLNYQKLFDSAAAHRTNLVFQPLGSQQHLPISSAHFAYKFVFRMLPHPLQRKGREKKIIAFRQQTDSSCKFNFSLKVLIISDVKINFLHIVATWPSEELNLCLCVQESLKN